MADYVLPFAATFFFFILVKVFLRTFQFFYNMVNKTAISPICRSKL